MVGRSSLRINNAQNKIILLVIFITVFSLVSIQTSYSANVDQFPYLRDEISNRPSEFGLDEFFKVSLFTGAFTYTYEIEVPPGTNNLQLDISLFYNSYRTTDLPTVLGTGWDLSQSYIQRDINNTANNL